MNLVKKVNFIRLNVLSDFAINKTLKEINPVCIYYFAGISSITKSFKYPKETYESNYFLKAVARMRFTRLLI